MYLFVVLFVILVIFIILIIYNLIIEKKNLGEKGNKRRNTQYRAGPIHNKYNYAIIQISPNYF